jgi:spore coat protein A, manganese oxidase
MTSRREFLKISTMGAAGLLLYKGAERVAFPYAQSPSNIRKFVIGLPNLGAAGANEIGQYIPLASPDTTSYPGADSYTIIMQQYGERLHPDLPSATRLWGYADGTNPRQAPTNRYLGPVIVAQRNRPVRVRYVNSLPPKHPLPVDNTLMGAESDQPENRAAVHLHGGLVPWTSDGGPFAWTTPGNKVHGVNWQPGDFLYPNNQSARLLWYHDHALGITRLNAYAGLASAYIIRDTDEQDLIASGIIPSLEIPLIIQDKTFVAKNISTIDPTWKWGKAGDLWYPHIYENTGDTARWDLGSDDDPPAVGTQPLPAVSCVPEAFLDTTLVNGACYPYLNVEPKRYRFRILNGANARFYNLQLYYADATGKEADLTRGGPPFIQIGTEGGFLPSPVVLNNPPLQSPLLADGSADVTAPFNLLLAPAERADVIIDFSAVRVGSKLILYSDTPAPFPSGDVRNDYFTGDPDETAFGGAPTTQEGFGPNTRTLMQFRVVPLSGSPDPYDFAASLCLLNRALPIAYANQQPRDLDATGLVPLGKTLNEDFDNYGRLIQRLGTTDQSDTNNQGLPTWGRDFVAAPVTETASQGETQVWNIFNLTGDTHPIHFHLVNVQVISRAPFDAETPDFKAIGGERPPDVNERGWKETVRMNPGEVTKVIMQFNAPDPRIVQPWATLRTSPRTGGYEYVWHCHILEHEEHDMMRPLVVS